MTTVRDGRASFGPVPGLSPKPSRADASELQILRNSFSTGGAR